MITVSDLLTQITQIAFVTLGILSLLDYLRFHGQVRRDIALMFASLAIAIGVGIINALLVTPSPLLSLGAAIAIIAQPFLLIRLVGYFRPIPGWIRISALVGMAASWGVIALSRASLPTLLTLVIILYFVVIDGYAMVAFVQGALITSGVVQQRLRFAAAGSGLLAFTLLLAGVGTVVRSLMPITSLLVQVTAILSAFSFYLGLAAPHWLRQTWQLRELREFLLQMNQDERPESAMQLYALLCQVTLKMTGGSRASLLLKPQQDNAGWTLHDPENSQGAATVQAITEIEPYWLRRSAGAIAIHSLSASLRASLRTGQTELMYVVPLARNRHSWGMVLVFLSHGSLFVEDDLQIMSLLAEQSAIALENVDLIEHLREYAVSLEEQTAHLTAVNNELEAFSYSVSHDLRAPLRAVDGFSQALLEDYDDLLDEMGRDFLHRIRGESQRMGQLIDDLIGLSRFTRTEMNVTTVDLSAIVREIAADLKSKEPNRTVEFLIQDGLKGCGDERLIRVALENLIGNAWKYSSKKPSARIEFGSSNEKGTPEYYVRDNGAGFEMTYANKLFGAFQRLHAMDEFVGTGIGLATVQRIMHRHGGAARAEGVVNVGATFYFTLGSRNCA